MRQGVKLPADRWYIGNQIGAKVMLPALLWDFGGKNLSLKKIWAYGSCQCIGK
jgi:hypothetical protein